MDNTKNIFPTYEGFPIIPSKHAQHELDRWNLDLWDVQDVLETGWNCEKTKRSKEIVERCREQSGKLLRVVMARVDFNTNKTFWRLIHVGKSAKHKP